MKDSIFDLTGKTVMVTGGGTGLGRHFAEVMAAAGARVIVCARRVEKLTETVSAIEAAGGQAVAQAMDVTSEDSVREAFAAAVGDSVVDVVVNNAGVVAKPSLLDTDVETWDNVQAANLKGPWLVAREAVRRLAAAEKPGRVVNISSILGSAVQKGTGPYSASKAALLHLTRNMAVEWARYGVTVNAIAPGYYVTDLAGEFLESPKGKALLARIPQRRLGVYDDLSGAILLLASDASAYMTGTCITVDGGLSLPIV
ncbi:SDR family NAD(P)-dependent oxidoreductase [Parahaliea aestuarii]|uniref:SDR family oxidoreductase n=1 Tax=Parahaliea aestuarii TaxID=1852021 RepID=A0A5C8ZNB2_9GAMM|nr:SDR family oxidoreductase [Parahaliea aestuarii]TXS89983.1 SDR family oxidoreductase [Parahaliea aestuarii]